MLKRILHAPRVVIVGTDSLKALVEENGCEVLSCENSSVVLYADGVIADVQNNSQHSTIILASRIGLPMLAVNSSAFSESTTHISSFIQSLKRHHGCYIIIEGGEGTGKGVHRGLLVEYLRAKGLDVIETREPGGSERAEAIRKVLLNPDFSEPMDPISEMMLFQAARAQLLSSVIRPALKKGTVVVSDRNYYSTMAYQGYGREMGLAKIDMMNRIATSCLTPDVGIIIDAPPAIAKITTTEFGKKDRIESEAAEFHERLRNGYLEVAKRERNVHVVSYVENGVAEMQEKIRRIVDNYIEHNYQISL